MIREAKPGAPTVSRAPLGRHRAPIVVAAAMTLIASGASIRAQADEATDAFLFGLGVRTRAVEAMSVVDVRPATRGEVGADVDVGLRTWCGWWLRASGYVGGTWFDYQGPASSGKIEDLTWLIRTGVDRRFSASRRVVPYLGVGVEYGESRSWLHAFAASEEGAHAYTAGGYVRLGGELQVAGPLRGYVEVSGSAYRAHATLSRLESEFNWLGRSLELGAGVRWVGSRGQPPSGE
jgi:hypothetical protein